MGGEFKVVTREHGVEELELADNGLRLLLVSDDNGSARQRTLLVYLQRRD